VDLIAVHPKKGVLAVQTTTGANHSHHLKKILAEPKAKVWLKAGGKILLLSWAKKGKRGSRKTWQPIEKEISLRDFRSGTARST